MTILRFLRWLLIGPRYRAKPCVACGLHIFKVERWDGRYRPAKCPDCARL